MPINKKHLSYLALCAVLLTTKSFAQTGKQIRQNRAVAERAAAEAFEQAWYRFADVIARKDPQAIKALSASCIRCFNCATDTEAKAGPASDSLAVEENNLLAIEDFLALHQQAIFSDETIARMRDTTKLRFHDNEVNADLYHDPCITGSAKKKAPACKEVLLLIVDPTPTFEGAQQAFAFIQTESGYKFCGYSTIP